MNSDTFWNRQREGSTQARVAPGDDSGSEDRGDPGGDGKAQSGAGRASDSRGVGAEKWFKNVRQIG
jgi:hypothetical protein